MLVPFDQSKIYDHKDGHITCLAFNALDHASYETWLKSDVANRVFDKPTIDAFAAEIAALSADGFDVSVLTDIQNAPYATTFADVGEGIADLFLMERHGAFLPSNRRRDLKNPNASQAGADIAGYVVQADGSYCFLFGEVKSSSDGNTPPSVMSNPSSGMVAQIKRVCEARGYQRTLMYYLRERSQDAVNKPFYDSALQNLAKGNLELVGVLVRDTQPNTADVKLPMGKMSKVVPPQYRCHVYVLHTCIPTADWLLHCKVA